LQAGIDWSVKWKKNDFIGRSALVKEREGGVESRIQFYEVEDRRIPRDGSKIFWMDKEMGKVLSGGFSPTIRKPIGSALIHSQGLDKLSDNGWTAEVRSSRLIISFGAPVLKKK
jgi:aminomethyltransferase